MLFAKTRISLTRSSRYYRECHESVPGTRPALYSVRVKSAIGGFNSSYIGSERGKLFRARYLVGLNIDINAVDTKARKTALDIAIDAADLWRDFLICNAIDTFGIGDHVDALEDGAAFTTNFFTGKPDSTNRQEIIA